MGSDSLALATRVRRPPAPTTGSAHYVWGAMIPTLEIALFLAGLVGLAAVAAVVGARLPRRRSVSDTATEDRERAELRQRSQFDAAAARELRRRLRRDLRSHAALRRDLARDGVPDRERAWLLQNIDRVERAARQQLAEVEAWLRARS
jgi:hypothetical protein